MKIEILDVTPPGWEPERGELFWYGDVLCVRTDIEMGIDGAFVALTSGFAYSGNLEHFKPFHGTVTISNEVKA